MQAWYYTQGNKHDYLENQWFFHRTMTLLLCIQNMYVRLRPEQTRKNALLQAVLQTFPLEVSLLKEKKVDSNNTFCQKLLQS